MYILRKLDGQEPKLRLATTQGSYLKLRKGEAQLLGRSVDIARLAQRVLGDESFDQTELTGLYDIDLKWDGSQPNSLIAAIHNQLGLELVADHRKLDHLVVDSVAETKTW